MNADMIVFGEDWGSHPSSTQHLIRHLAKGRRVMWVNSIGLRRPRVSLRDFRRLLHKGSSVFQKQKKEVIEGPMEVIAPKLLPWPGNRLMTWMGSLSLDRQLGNILLSHDFDAPVIWTSLPTAIDYIDKIKRRALIYYCGDDFGALEGVDHKPVLECETRLAEQADLIITVSEKLAAKFPQEKTLLLPHGVDFDLFSTPAKPAKECISNRPIAGFYGSLAEWVDVDLIATTARNMPDWDFMFVGPVKTDITAFEGLENIKLVGPQAHKELPRFVQHWQAALLPFKDNEQIRSCNPLKLREYIASNTPVLTTSYPAMEEYRDVVQVFNSSKELVEKLRQLKPLKQQAKRVEKESWTNRAEKLEHVIRQWNG